METLIILLACGLVFVGVYITASTFFQQETARSAGLLLSEADIKNKPSPDAIIKYARPLVVRYLLPIVANLKIDPIRARLKQKIIAAGLADNFSPDEVFGLKLFLIPGLPAFAYFVNWIGEFDLPPIAYLGIAAFGYIYPDTILSQVIQKRQKEVRRALPFVVDLLALSTEAGLDFLGAMGKVVEKAKPSALVDEFEQVLKEIKVGSSRADAMRAMAARLTMPEVSSFVAILISADQMGASIANILRQQSDQMRNERFVAGEREGSKAATKILIPLVTLILPAIMLAIFGPYLVAFVASGGSFI